MDFCLFARRSTNSNKPPLEGAVAEGDWGSNPRPFPAPQPTEGDWGSSRASNPANKRFKHNIST